MLCWKIVTILLAQLVHYSLQSNDINDWDVLPLLRSANKTIFRYDYELYSKFLLGAMLPKLSQSHRERWMLCSTYLRWSEHEKNILISNVAQGQGMCSDWTIILYHANDHPHTETIVKELEEMLQERGIQMTVELGNSEIIRDEKSFPGSRIKILTTPSTKINSIPLLKEICEKHIRKHWSDVIDEHYRLQIDKQDENHVAYVNIFDNLVQFPKATRLFSPCQFIQSPPTAPDETERYNHQLVSKAIFFVLLLQDLPSYEHVWLLDSDMAFDTLNITKLHHFHTSSFSHLNVPIVSQVLITPNTQGKVFLNRVSWENVTFAIPHFQQPLQTPSTTPFLVEEEEERISHTVPITSIVAMETDFVEIQSPILNAKYFEWFVLAFLVPFLPTFQILGVDWGIDYLFCPSARLFVSYLAKCQQQLHDKKGCCSMEDKKKNLIDELINMVLMEPVPASSQPFVCALFMSDLVIHHKDLRTAGARKDDANRKLNRELIAVLLSAFPLQEYCPFRGNPLDSPENFQFLYEV